MRLCRNICRTICRWVEKWVDSEKLVLSEEEILVYAPLLLWYVDHREVKKAVY